MSVSCVIIKGGLEAWQIEARREPATTPTEEVPSSPSRTQLPLSFERPLVESIRGHLLTFKERSVTMLTKSKDEIIDVKNRSLRRITEQTKHWLPDLKTRTVGCLSNFFGTYKPYLLVFATVYTVTALWNLLIDIQRVGQLCRKLMSEMQSNNQIAVDATSQQLTVFFVFIVVSQGGILLTCVLPFWAELKKKPGCLRVWNIFLFYAMLLQFFRIFYDCYYRSSSRYSAQTDLYFMNLALWNFGIIGSLLWVTVRRAEEMKLKEMEAQRIRDATDEPDFGGQLRGVRRARRERRNDRCSRVDREAEIAGAHALVVDLPPSYAEIEIEQEFLVRNGQPEAS